MQQLESYHEVIAINLSTSSERGNALGLTTKKWAKPLGGLLKCNWDVAINPTTIGLGGIVWNSKGEVLATFYSNISVMLKPVVAEATALWKTMLICRELGLSEILFEGECL